MTVLIAAAQLNQTVGDFEGNARRIIEAAGKAAAQGARVLLTPELSLSGYPPEDLLLRAAFYDRCQEGLAQILAQCAGLDLHVVVGAPLMREGVRRNAALVLHRGAIVGEYFKRYGLTPEKLALAKPDAIVMHPGPMNRGVEIDSSVADGPQAVILNQVTFGIAVRMAVMGILAGN